MLKFSKKKKKKKLHMSPSNIRGCLDLLFPSLITQNMWVPRLRSLFGFCFHHSILLFLSDELWKFKIHFRCFQFSKLSFQWHFHN